jgi:hypothetical protein
MIYWAIGIYIAIGVGLFIAMVKTMQPLDRIAWVSVIIASVLWPLTFISLFTH